MLEEFNAIASTFPDPFRLLVRESAGSTNDEVRILAQSGAPGGLVMLALNQTAGRGRRGAAWFSSPGDSLALSILLRPEEPKALWPRLALAAGVAVAEAIESFGPATGIKWPNDVWIGGRKVAGILVEAGNDFAIVGIGLNVNTRQFPEEVADIATSLAIAADHSFARAEVLAAIVRRFAHRQQQIGRDFENLLEPVRHRCLLSGQIVSLLTSSGPKQGKIEGIAPGGELLLRTTNGVETLLQADEIRIVS